MSGFTENRASEAEQAGRPDRVFTWHACRAMLPLVERIAQDILEHHQSLNRLRPEMAHLEEHRRNLTWPQRARRYQLEEQIGATEQALRAVVAELEALGVDLLDAKCGLVGFPTRVNDRRAYFSWQPGEEGLGWWNYAGDRVRRSVPPEWTEQTRERPARGPGGGNNKPPRSRRKG